MLVKWTHHHNNIHFLEVYLMMQFDLTLHEMYFLTLVEYVVEYFFFVCATIIEAILAVSVAICS